MFNLYIIFAHSNTEYKYKCEKVIVFNGRFLARIIIDNGTYDYLDLDMSNIVCLRLLMVVNYVWCLSLFS